MSRGVIIEHLGEARYRVRQELASDRIQEDLERLNKRIAELSSKVPEKKLELLAANAAVDDKVRDINLLIPDLQSGVEGARREISKLQVEMIRLQGAAARINILVTELVAEQLSALKRRAQLESIPEGREMEAWCADYSTQLDGEVSLVDINDEGGQGTVIHPGHNNGAVYNPAKDGELFPNIAQSASQIFFNAAVLPGVQKWMPMYRAGTITEIVLDSCTVALDEALSSAQDLPINQAFTLYEVPIKYMDCDGLVFSVGDRVVVRYTQAGPLVVGFESQPKQCGTRLICTPMLSTDVWTATYYGAPFETSAGQINPPLGTEGGDYNAWIFSTLPASPYYSYLKGESQQIYGLRNWIGSRPGDVLSWHGPPSRICCLSREMQGSSMINLYDFTTHPPYGTHVYYKRRLVCDLKDVPGLLYGNEPIVDGAAIVYKGTDNLRYLRICASNMTNGVYDQWTTSASFYKCTIIDLPWFGENPDLERPQVLHEFSADYFAPPTQGMYFSQSGHKATICFGRDFYQLSVLRWDKSAGFSEDGIIQVGDEDGVRTGTFVFDRSDSATYLSTNRDWSGEQQQYEQTIGFEFIGDTEEPIKVIHGEVSHARARFNAQSFEYFDDPGGAYYRSTGEEFSETESVTLQPMKIAVGSNVIYRADAPSFESSTIAFQDTHASDGTLRRTGSGSRQEETHSFGKFPMVIDARFSVVACEYIKGTQTSETQHSGASGYSIVQTDRAVSYRVYRNGNKIIDLPAPLRTRIENTNFDHAGTGYARTTRPEDGPFDADEYFEAAWAPEFGNPGAFDSFFHINSPNTSLATNTRIRQASVAESNGKLMMAFEWMKRIDDNEYEPVRFTYMDDIANPVGQFMERDPADGYMLGKVGLI